MGSPGPPPSSKTMVFLKENIDFRRSPLSPPWAPEVDFGSQNHSKMEAKSDPKRYKNSLRKSDRKVTQNRLQNGPGNAPQMDPTRTEKNTKKTYHKTEPKGKRKGTPEEPFLTCEREARMISICVVISSPVFVTLGEPHTKNLTTPHTRTHAQT